MVRPGWHEQLSSALWIGIIWGLAYLAKAVAFPLALALLAGMTVVWWKIGAHNGKKIRRDLLATLLGFAMSGRAMGGRYGVRQCTINFVPSRGARNGTTLWSDHPIPTGSIRCTGAGTNRKPGASLFWEDPDLPYPDWSPLANAANVQRQILIILRNLPKVALMLTLCLRVISIVAGDFCWKNVFVRIHGGRWPRNAGGGPGCLWPLWGRHTCLTIW